jgi:serine/threonine-protein kinase
MRLCGVDGTALEPMRKEGSTGDRYIGRTIKGRYQIIKKLGEGGMGAVYLAEQISMARKVALKVLQGNYATDDEFIGRFRREARLAASLNHPYIVTVYDFDQGDEGSLFIAMEYIDGKSLTDVIRRDGPLDIGRAAGLGIQIAEGLDAAHRAGVIHRDIKPDNIMVVGDEDLEKVKLMDFGIARLRDSGTMSRLTRAGVIMGTPAYMAPEQAEGAEVSERTDIYALGIVLYEMLSGSVPFRASTPGAVLVKQIQEIPLPLRNLRREVPTAIESLVMQALEKNPAKRQRDMREVAQGLRRIERTAADDSALRTGTVVNATMIDDAPRTIAATQVSAGGLLEKPKIHGKYLKVGIVTVVAVVALLFGVFRGSNWLSRDNATKPFPATSNPVSSEPPQERVVSERTRPVEEPAKSRDNKGESDKGLTGVTSVSKRPEVPAKTTATAPRVAERPPVEKGVLLEKVNEHLKIAKFFRERGEYADAFAELEKARRLDPGNIPIKAELNNVRKACQTEKEVLGRTNLKCN